MTRFPLFVSITDNKSCTILNWSAASPKRGNANVQPFNHGIPNKQKKQPFCSKDKSPSIVLL